MRNPRTKALFFRVERTVMVQVFNCVLLHIVPKSVNLGYQRYLRSRPSVRIRRIHACISTCKAAWHQLKKISFCCYCFQMGRAAAQVLERRSPKALKTTQICSVDCAARAQWSSLPLLHIPARPENPDSRVSPRSGQKAPEGCPGLGSSVLSQLGPENHYPVALPGAIFLQRQL